jgi:hypothetical protein
MVHSITTVNIKHLDNNDYNWVFIDTITNMKYWPKNKNCWKHLFFIYYIYLDEFGHIIFHLYLDKFCIIYSQIGRYVHIILK